MPDDALAGDRLKVAGLDQFETSVPGAGHDGAGQRVLAASLQARGQAKQIVFVHALAGTHRRQPRFALG